MKQLEVKSVTKSFDSSNLILQSISFDLPKGEFLVILGPSGCGKTTLLRIIAGLEQLDSGSIHISGKDVTNLEPKDRNVAMVFQNYALYPHMTVYDNLAFALKVRKQSKQEIDDTVTRTARMIGLDQYLGRKPKQLSGGQRQRVALGRAIVRNPSLFLFDEPLSNLDAELRSQMRFELLSLHRQLNATSLYVTHDQVEAMSLADNIIILNQGKQIGPAKPRDLYDNPPDTFVAGFLGNPGMNLLEATVDEDGRSGKLDDGVSLAIDRQLPAGSKVIIGFRPEHCRPAENGNLPARITGIEDSGKEYILKLIGPRKARIYCLTDKDFNLGDSIKLELKKTHYFDYQSKCALP
jgi:ABC-type sugar transport system ATPase subunit